MPEDNAPDRDDLIHTAAVDRMLHAALGRITLGISPASLLLAYADWLMHLGMSPGKQLELLEKARRKLLRWHMYAARSVADPGTEPCIEPLAQDQRFRSPEWLAWPFNLYYTGFLLMQQWWHNATTGVRGVSRHHEQVVSFVTRQLLDIWAPSNFLFTNPELLKATLERGGTNLEQGLRNYLEDTERYLAHLPDRRRQRFQVGRDVAVTPGKVVYRNRLIELIQYEATGDRVRPEPVLFIPAWIMKYYILDLSPDNSLVNYLRGQGFTVFMVSWKNPDSADEYLRLSDYRRLGVEAALEVARVISGAARVHAVGYCLGGTLLTLAAALMAREGIGGLASISLFAAQTDFSDAGELTLFIDDSQVSFLEDMMWDRGYLGTSQMAGAFQLLRSNDLFWSRMVREYLLGERQPMNDLMAWNLDATRMPFRMHSEYLHRLFLKNELAEGKYGIGGRPVAISDIRAPLFVLGTETDHVAPWRSVYKIHLQADTQITFVLTRGGHNAGIVSPPGRPRRHYRYGVREAEAAYVDPDTWLATSPVQEGSWWPFWCGWLADYSGDWVPAPSVGAPGKGLPALAEAPGDYVLMP